MFLRSTNVKFTLIIFLLTALEFRSSSALLYIVRQSCSRGTVFTPQPSTVSNICLQCVCVMADISYCKPLIVQLSIICSAAITASTTTPTTTTTRTTTTVPPVIITVPTIPAATATTAIGINPRASTPAASAMMNPPPTTLMVTGSPMMMMMMAAAGAAGMTIATATMAPAPAAAG